MDIVILIIFSFFSYFFASRIPKKLARVYLYVVLAIWIIPLGISMLNPFDLYSVSLETYIIVLIGSFSFIIGYSFTRQKREPNNEANIVNSITNLSKLSLFKIFFLFNFLFIGILAVAQWKLIEMQGGMGNLKLDLFELIFNNNSILYFIYQALSIPLFYILSMIVTFSLISGKFNKTIILYLVYILIFSYVGGKRGYFAIFIQYFLIAFIVRLNITKLKNMRKIPIAKIALIGGAMIVGAAYMTASGKSSTGDDSINAALSENSKNYILYQIGPYRAFDYALENNYLDKYGAYTYGRSSFGGFFDYYGSGILKLLGLNIKDARSLSMKPLQDNSIYISRDRDWNFSFTSFYYFLFDFGWLGIIIVPLIFGMFVRYSVNLFIAYKTIGSMCLMGYLFMACFLFQASWFNVALYAIPTILICLIVSKWEIKQSPKRENKRLTNIQLHKHLQPSSFTHHLGNIE